METNDHTTTAPATPPAAPTAPATPPAAATPTPLAATAHAQRAAAPAATTPQVKGRFAPTPSGRMHLGNAFCGLMAWLAARAACGRFLLRIEDLDPRAQDPRAADTLLRDLEWLGLDWDEGPYYQSARATIYSDALDRLQYLGLVYPCFCTRAEVHAATAPHASDGTYVYPGTCRGLSPAEAARRAQTRRPSLRLRVPDENDPAGTFAWRDLVYGAQRETLACDCGDFIVRRSDGVFAYQLAVAVDDALMGVTQVVRGRDILGSCARQMYVGRLLGFDAPTYAHVPLLVAPSGRRLSKRDGDLDLGAVRASGADPREVTGFLAALAGLVEPGCAASPSELVAAFSWEKLRAHRADVVIDTAEG